MSTLASVILSNTITKRFIATFIDVMPIIIGVFFLFYYFMGLDKDIINYLYKPGNIEFRTTFKLHRIVISALSFILWILYGMLMDCSKTQGTHGKQMMGLKVTDMKGERIDCKTAVTRNIAKIASIAPIFFGLIWILFNPQRQSWHDRISKTKLTEIH